MAGNDSHCSQRSSQLQNFLVLFLKLQAYPHTLLLQKCNSTLPHAALQSVSVGQASSRNDTAIIFPMTASSSTWSEKTLQLKLRNAGLQKITTENPWGGRNIEHTRKQAPESLPWSKGQKDMADLLPDFDDRSLGLYRDLS